MRAAISFLVLSLAGCGGSGDSGDPFLPSGAELGREYVVGYGETLALQGGLWLEFTTLAEDSRCPINANCFWEGNGRILVTVMTPRGTSVIELNTAMGFATSMIYDGYGIELRKLAPFPVAGTRTPVNEYEATLFIDSVAAHGNQG